MRVLLQYPNLEEPPIGVWWDEGGEARYYYADPFRPEARSGQQRIASRTPDVPLSEVFDKLAERLPYDVSWELADTGDAFTPEEYLDMIRRVQFHVLGAA